MTKLISICLLLFLAGCQQAIPEGQGIWFIEAGTEIQTANYGVIETPETCVLMTEKQFNYLWDIRLKVKK